MPVNVELPNPAQQSDVIAALTTAIQAVPLAPPVVTATPLAPASTTYTYVVVAKVNGDVIPGSVTITTGAAALSVAAANTLNWNTIPGAIYDVYRTTGGATQGKIASNVPGVSLNPYGGVNAVLQNVTLVDSGLPGDASTVPPFNTSGVLSSGVQQPVQVIAANGPISISTGVVVITKGSLAALTLAQPVAGSAQAGGQDGSRLTIVATTAFAHTVTTAAAGINGASHLATLAASPTLGTNAFELIAYNGVWYVVNLGTATLTA